MCGFISEGFFSNLAKIDKVKKCLEGVMKNGTGSDLKSVEFNIAGKTGTAKIMDESGQFLDRKNSEYQASFCGYFPAENPLYSCIVVFLYNLCLYFVMVPFSLSRGASELCSSTIAAVKSGKTSPARLLRAHAA